MILVTDERGGEAIANSVSCASTWLPPCLSVFLSLCGQSVSAIPSFLSGDSQGISPGVRLSLLILSWLMIVLINGTAYNTETSISSFNWFNFYRPSGKNVFIKCYF